MSQSKAATLSAITIQAGQRAFASISTQAIADLNNPR
jgi:hypothetical protein